MAALRHLIAQIKALFRGDAVADEIREELQSHLAMRAEDLERAGLPAADARRTAAQRFGNVALLQDQGYDVRGGGWMETVLQDLRYGVRLLLAQRASSLVAVLTLAVGVGLTTALFSVIHAAVLRPLPYQNPEQLVSAIVREQRRDRTSGYAPSLQDLRLWRGPDKILTHAALQEGPYQLIVDAGDPDRASVVKVSEDYFEAYGVRPAAGRSFVEDDVRRDSPFVAILGHRYWRTRFGADRGAIGRVIRIENEPATVIGILPADFEPSVAVWQPLRWNPGFDPMRGSGARNIGRLRPGVAWEAAESELSRVAAQFSQGRVISTSVVLRSEYERTTGGVGSTVGMLAGSVGAILLIACVNVAGLLLARGATRQRELAVRASIGAGRSRLVRQLLTESVVLAVAGAATGVLLAWVSLESLVAIVPLSLPRSATPSLNLEVLAFSVAVALLTPILFGLVPALRLSRLNMSHALAGADRRAGAALSRRGGQWLIGAQVTLAVVLLAGAGLMIRSFGKLVAVDLGFEPGAFMTMQVAPLDRSPAAAAEYYPVLLARIRQISGVAAAGAADQLPLGGSRSAEFIRVEGRPEPFRVDERQVLPGFFEAMGFTLTQGRFPTETDRISGRHLVVINEATARGVFGTQPVVGRALPLRTPAPEIIGVVGDILQDGARGARRPNVFRLYRAGVDLGRHGLVIFVRPDGGARPLAGELRAAAHAIGPRVHIDAVRSGDDFLADTVVVPRRRMVLLGLLGGVGLLLTLIGVSSMTAYAVARRTREIGVRVAFGATGRDVVRAVARDAITPVTIGLTTGLVGAYFTTRILASLLYETTPHDPAAFAAAALVLGLTAAIAAWLPARRAASVDPMRALNSD
jgi:predicted permease